jgi:hypothetical protein
VSVFSGRAWSDAELFMAISSRQRFRTAPLCISLRSRVGAFQIRS